MLNNFTKNYNSIPSHSGVSLHSVFIIATHNFYLPLFFCALLIFTTASMPVLAAESTIKNQTDFEKYTVRHVVFNSSFVLPEIASIYNIKRSKYESLLNIAVTEKNRYGGLPVKIKGHVKNLLQQQVNLEFQEIREETATYYLAPVRISNEEVLHFTIEVTPPDGSPMTVKFSQTVYADE